MSELAIARTLIPSIAGVGLFIFVVLTLANASDGDSGMSGHDCKLFVGQARQALFLLDSFYNML